MYGYTPIAATLILRIAPPLNRSSIPKSWFRSNSCLNPARSTPGRGTWAISRKTARIMRVKSIRFLRSGSRKASIIDRRRDGLLDCTRYLLHTAARRFYLLFCRSREFIGFHLKRNLQIAIA